MSKEKSVIESHIVDLLEHSDDKTLLLLKSQHNHILSTMSFIRADSFNQKEILDLVGWGMIAPVKEKIHQFKRYELTSYGYAVASYLKQRNRRKMKDHDLLALIFARQKKKAGLLPFLDIELKSDNGVCRPDIFTMKATYNEDNMNPTAYEVKVSRADFLSDMSKPDKWKAYLDIANSLYYICPEGLIDKKEVPKECGLIYYDKSLNSFNIKKRPKKYPKSVSQANMMRLILKSQSNNNTVLVKKPY